MVEEFDVVVVGGGIVGLSTAYALTVARPGVRVAVLEKEPDFAAHQTGRNSGVIHSGVYYRPGSLKAQYATAGAAEMVEFCHEQGVPYEVTGKLIVATGESELPRLRALVERGRANGIPVTELGPAGIAEYEPEVTGLAGLHIGTTGICDYAAVARRYARLAEQGGAVLLTGTALRAVHRRPDGLTLRAGDRELRTGVLVNCAGLHSDRIARLAGDDPGVRIVPFRGEYYELTKEKRELVRGLVYPVPDPAFPFLGVHLTRGIHGDVHVGPNAVPALAREGYDWRTVRLGDLAETVRFPGTWRIARRHWRYELGELHRSLSKRAFTTAVRRLLPAVTAADLVPATAGVRAQAVAADGTLLDDFAFAGFDPADAGSTRRMVHVLNAPSPAATASLAIGREVARRGLAALAAGG
ncbi:MULTISPECIES: L-2-hydroxyglutarate oxidase [unclassified Kitasatospora]|uniref:L-2-hydroxyglutarate oxidase n=1 Tax=unclassified Kitasatospora TaxID=2633591 RepID=UPI00070AF9F3|nr:MULTISPECIES: L-2-hydroxyglutarate oxidase [unclassified Kitasatospora]KQV19805.1 hydroxyglutarate oxidase [Kitasatospora sp. Root107]KRB61297.1 hydroxyglutarate oxidase [Kitasatospora sp. Root187]